MLVLIWFSSCVSLLYYIIAATRSGQHRVLNSSRFFLVAFMSCDQVTPSPFLANVSLLCGNLSFVNPRTLDFSILFHSFINPPPSSLPQSVFLARVPAAVLSGLVHLGPDQQQGERRAAERSAHLRRGAVRPAAGDLPLRLLQAAEVSHAR